MIIKFKNWEKHQTRKDVTKTHWFKLSNDLFSDPKMCELDDAQFRFLVYLLCEASKANNGGAFFFSRIHCRIHNRLQDREQDRALSKLQELQIIEQPTLRGRYVNVTQTCSRLEEKRLEERREEKKVTIENPPTAIEPLRANPVGIWISAYKAKYGVRYEVQSKDGKILTTFAKTRTEDQIRTLFACYLAIEEKLYSESKHPLSLFFRDLQKISVAALTGVDPSRPAKFDYTKLED